MKEKEYGSVLERIKEETLKDETLQKLKNTVVKENWEQNKKDSEIAFYYSLRNEIYIADGLLFQLNKIIVPEKLREKVVRSAHKMGSFWYNKNKANDKRQILVPRNEQAG